MSEEKLQVRCPKCGSTYYSVNYRTATALAFPQVYIGGIPQPRNSDPNYYTSNCSCLNCGANLTSTQHYDSISNKIDCYQPDVNKIQPLVDAAKKAWAVSAEEMRKDEIQRLKERIAKLQQELQELEIKDGFLSNIEVKPGTYKTGATCGE